MADRPSEPKVVLEKWIEELLPSDTADKGSQPLDLQELESTLSGSIDRRAAARRNHAA